jgi:phospholipid N-methyltransferase
MTTTNRHRHLLNGRFAFFQEFIKHPLEIGSIVPSSRFLERRILDAAEIESAETIVELGCGNGGTTRAILGAMPRRARLLSIDVNPRFHQMIRGIRDNRLIAHLGNAGALEEILSQYGLGAPDVVISGIPFSTMDHRTASKICQTISSLLAARGRFVAYQVSPRVASLTRPLLGPERVAIEFLNVPPMRVYQWEKHDV